MMFGWRVLISLKVSGFGKVMGSFWVNLKGILVVGVMISFVVVNFRVNLVENFVVSFLVNVVGRVGLSYCVVVCVNRLNVFVLCVLWYWKW